MDTFSQQEFHESAWQAVNVMFMKQFKEKLTLAINRTECLHVQPPKELTTEALSMIVVMAVFTTFAVLGSLNTVFEFLCEKNAERKKLIKNMDSKNFTNDLWKKDWINYTKSFLQCFCFVKNGKKLFQADTDKMQFECFHGIRVISNISVICYHIGLYNLYAKRSDEIKLFSQAHVSKLLFNTYFAVDSFLVLSGFLNAYSFSIEYKKNGKISWWHFYLKRFVRLTPAYMVVLGIYTCLLNYAGSGPIWPEYATNPVCKENWWRYLLYINNFESSETSCMVWCWQLAAEMQLYVASPIFLLSLLRWRRFGYSLTSLIIFLSGLYSFLISKHLNLIWVTLLQFVTYNGDIVTFIDEIWRYADALYYKPYPRLSSYLIGVLLGYYFYGKNFKDIKNSWITLCFGWIASGILIWISLFALVNREESPFETALFNSVKHLFYSVSLSWIIFVCLTKQGGFLNFFLSWKLFLPFSKLSYCAYLIHMVIIQRDYQAAQQMERFCFLSMTFYLLRVYFWTIVFSIPVYLLFEMPMINLFILYTKKEEMKKIKACKEKTKEK